MNTENLTVFYSRSKTRAVDSKRLKGTTPLGVIKSGDTVERVLYGHFDSETDRLYRSEAGMTRLNARPAKGKTGDPDHVQVYLSPILEDVLRGAEDYRKSVGIVRLNGKLIARLFVAFEFGSANAHYTESGNLRLNARPLKDQAQQADSRAPVTETVGADIVDGDGIPGEVYLEGEDEAQAPVASASPAQTAEEAAFLAALEQGESAPAGVEDPFGASEEIPF